MKRLGPGDLAREKTLQEILAATGDLRRCVLDLREQLVVKDRQIDALLVIIRVRDRQIDQLLSLGGGIYEPFEGDEAVEN